MAVGVVSVTQDVAQGQAVSASQHLTQEAQDVVKFTAPGTAQHLMGDARYVVTVSPAAHLQRLVSPWDLLDEPAPQDLREEVDFEPNLDPSTLMGLRLGKLERRALLEAAAPYEKPNVGSLDKENRSSRESWLRAVRKLEGRGLVDRTYVQVGESFRDNEAAARLTVLGQAVVSALRDDLEAGRPIRWAVWMDDVRAQLRLEPWSLLGHLRLKVEGRLWFYAWGKNEERKREFHGLLALIDRSREPLDNPRPGYTLSPLRGLPVWALEAHCPECGRTFGDDPEGRVGQVSGDLVFCSYSCRRTHEETKDDPKYECIRCGYRARNGKKIVGLKSGEGLCFDCAAGTARALLERITDERELTVFRDYFFRELGL